VHVDRACRLHHNNTSPRNSTLLIVDNENFLTTAHHPGYANMASNMAVEAPTFHSLNKPQKRALMLRDRLRYIDNKHLESFISSLSENEPPNYKRINGTVQPPLVLAILKPTAIRYDLGNVHFDSNEHGPPGIYRAYLTVEDGSFELRTEDAIPADEANLESVPIHIFIAKTMVSMFETKFKAIWTRMKQINDIRQVAFDMAGKTQEQEQFRAGEVGQNPLCRACCFAVGGITSDNDRAWMPSVPNERPSGIELAHL
jgi:hypothetical protein